MLTCHICHIYRTWKSIIWVGGDFEVIISGGVGGWGGKPKRMGPFYGTPEDIMQRF